MVYDGQYLRKPDSSRRLKLPGVFLDKQGDTGFIITRHFSRALCLISPEIWEKISRAVKGPDMLDPMNREMARHFFHGAVRVNADRYGRITIPSYLFEYMDAGKEVLLAGRVNRIEIWDPKYYELKADSREIFDKFFELHCGR